jgi:transposase
MVDSSSAEDGVRAQEVGVRMYAMSAIDIGLWDILGESMGRPLWQIFGTHADKVPNGCRWCDCPPEYGPPTTIYNRFARRARRRVCENLFRELAGNGRSTETQMIDSTHAKARRSAAGRKGGSKSGLLAARADGATRRPMLGIPKT